MKNPPNYLELRIEDGVLYKHILDVSSLGDYYFGWRMVVGDSEKASEKAVILKECHDDLREDHFGFFKTLSLIRAKYYLPQIYSNVKTY